MAGVLGVGRTALRSALERVGRGWGSIQERRPLDHDLLEGPDAYIVVFDAPGVRGADVDVRFVDRTVEVRLERDREDRDGFEWIFPGRGRELSGSATLPADAEVTPTGADATLTRSGTLEVTIPKDAAEGSVSVSEEESAAETDDAE
ncbi:Hsp20/alpha crystallin family protein [Halopenitus persicus]|uniref:Molecular chaperone IbpA, HSP20 family n=1 Tax=Halopenitus persicus TaxID=1048396 RepID=A0A1H3G8H4_9EURY|nr:Hsp20/alpha crystallin family protein [Halopenitus persicus]QHS16938.1 Hsp20/alpha crystallin family protein [haloarchaeon 3A1-DGR]SDX99561.1 Molecular chaperone IbpA, HSP20 family [Halopenitus persicus]